MNNLSIVQTSDGSKTIYNAAVGENYHSKHGALQESRHVFLKSGLEYFLENNQTQHVSILEIGFGTGLNFLLTADYCSKHNIKLNYTGLEAYPLSNDMIGETGYENYIAGDLWESFQQNYPMALDKKTSLNSNCDLQIVVQKLEDFIPVENYDVLYFDAFAAIHQPEMWTDEALKNISESLKKGGVFVTYAITGNLKRSMKALGFSIEKAPGAPGKREMLRAIKF